MKTATIPKRFADVPTTLPTGRVYLIVGPDCWGKGDTLEAAIRECKKAGGGGWKPASTPCTVYAADTKCYVDSYGYLTTPPKNSTGETERTVHGSLTNKCDGEPIPGESPEMLASF